MPFIMTRLWYLSGLYVWIYQGCLWHCIWHDNLCLSWHAFDFYRGYVSGEAHLPSSGCEYKLLSGFEFIKAVSDTVFYMICLLWPAFDFIGATFREKLVSHHQAVNINCWVGLSLSRLFLTLYFIWYVYYDKPLILSRLRFGRRSSPIIEQWI